MLEDKSVLLYGRKWPAIASIKSNSDNLGGKFAAVSEYLRKCVDILSPELLSYWP
jgi:hypothetical protein